MKIAYTLNGLVGGFSGKSASNANKDEDSILILKYVSDLIQRYIVPYNDVDIFIFSWHTNFKDEFEKYLSPKRIKLIPQKDFSIPEHLSGGNTNRVIAHKSRWYGFKEVINLVSEYESENNFEYDLVVNSRFDMLEFMTRPGIKSSDVPTDLIPGVKDIVSLALPEATKNPWPGVTTASGFASEYA